VEVKTFIATLSLLVGEPVGEESQVHSGVIGKSARDRPTTDSSFCRHTASLVGGTLRVWWQLSESIYSTAEISEVEVFLRLSPPNSAIGSSVFVVWDSRTSLRIYHFFIISWGSPVLSPSRNLGKFPVCVWRVCTLKCWSL